jgi:endo-1,3(4)-beta-glucanase
MWGTVTGDAAMEARGNLQLAVQARSLQNYYLMTSDNTVQPSYFVPNKAAGIVSSPPDPTSHVSTDMCTVDVRGQDRSYDLLWSHQ